MLISSVLSVLFGCSEYEVQMGSNKSSDYDESYEDPNMEGDSSPNDGNDDGFGSENEEDSLMLRPATTDSYVFVANPDRNTVTRISVPSLEVITAEVGVHPSLVETSSDYTRAITFNEGSNSVSIIDAETLDVTDVSIRGNLNQMKMSPDGNWAICYHDLEAENGGSGQGGAISYNAISIVDLDNVVHYEAMAGSHPHDVQYTEDSSLAVVISNDYLSVIDLTAATPTPMRIEIADDLINPPVAEEVLLDPEGHYAIVRQYGVDELVLVDLQVSEDQVSMISVGSNPTDMDVSADGSQALVVARGDQQIWIYDLSDPTLAPQVLDLPQEEVFGSLLLNAAGSEGILYSTASGLSRMGIWDVNSDEVVVRGLIKPVSSVNFSPTGDTAILFHSYENGDTPMDSYYYNSHALSLVDMDDLFSSSYRLTAEPDSFDSTPDGKIGFYTMKNQPYLELLDYETFVPDEVQLPSNPIHLGTLPDSNVAFVSQEHNLGRISFFDTSEDNLQTVTGFELNAAIEE